MKGTSLEHEDHVRMEIVAKATGRVLAIEHRGEYGWFLVERGQTRFGFQTRKLMIAYLNKVVKQGRLHTPTASECYR